MNVSGTSSMEQAQMQLRKMDGTGGGQGKGGMREIMNSLSSDDQASLKAELSSMTQEERMAKVSEMKQVDKTKMTDQEYAQTLLDILDTAQTNEDETDGFSVYA